MAQQEGIALYSHDALGLGHVRRNLAIAETLVRERSSTVLLIAGTRQAAAYRVPKGIDLVALPELEKRSDGTYVPRSLSLPLDRLLDIRAETIRAALETFRPELLIVDKQPEGVGGELRQSLRSLRPIGTRLVLGLRDVLDDASTARREWRKARSDEVVESHYDAVWVYGDPRVFNPVKEYGFPPETAEKVRFTGYIDRGAGRNADSPPGPGSASRGESSIVLCLVGGGEDGRDLAEAFAAADFPHGAHGVILTGPFMPPPDVDRLRTLAEGRSDLALLAFIDDPAPLIAEASSVVSMGGYNSICELLAMGKRSLIVPRIRTRREQLVRAHRLRQLGLIDVIEPGQLSAGALGRWLEGDAAPAASSPDVDLNGLTRIPRLVGALLEGGGRRDKEKVLARKLALACPGGEPPRSKPRVRKDSAGASPADPVR